MAVKTEEVTLEDGTKLKITGLTWESLHDIPTELGLAKQKKILQLSIIEPKMDDKEFEKFSHELSAPDGMSVFDVINKLNNWVKKEDFPKTSPQSK